MRLMRRVSSHTGRQLVQILSYNLGTDERWSRRGTKAAPFRFLNEDLKCRANKWLFTIPLTD